MTDTDLLPCPLCGNEAYIERPGTHKQSMIVSCHYCGCRHEGPDVVGETKPENYQWNRRVSTPSSTRANERGGKFSCDICEWMTGHNPNCPRSEREKRTQPSPQSEMVAVPREVVEKILGAFWPVSFIYADQPTAAIGDFEKGAPLNKAQILAMQEALSMLQPYTKGEK